jgi:phage terminase large subunit-like protein
LNIDPYKAEFIGATLRDEHGIDVYTMNQGIGTISEPAKSLERRMRAEKIRHGGNPLFRWSAGNVMVKVDENENIKPIKSKSTGRIDPIVAAIMAIARCEQGKAMHRSAYDDPDMLAFLGIGQ